MLRLTRHAVFLLWMGVRFLIPFAAASDYVFADDNDDIRQAWSLLHDDTQPIPIIR